MQPISAIVQLLSAIVQLFSAVMQLSSAVVQLLSAVVQLFSASVQLFSAVVQLLSAVVQLFSAVVQLLSAVKMLLLVFYFVFQILNLFQRGWLVLQHGWYKAYFLQAYLSPHEDLSKILVFLCQSAVLCCLPVLRFSQSISQIIRQEVFSIQAENFVTFRRVAQAHCLRAACLEATVLIQNPKNRLWQKSKAENL